MRKHINSSNHFQFRDGLALRSRMLQSRLRRLDGAYSPMKLTECRVRTNLYDNTTNLLITQFPQELIDALINQIDDAIDMFALGLTCSHFFRLLAPQMQSALVTDAAPWVGDRLIFVGDYADGVPPGIATDAEIPSRRDPKETSDSEDEGEGYRDPNPLYNLGEDLVVGDDDGIEKFEAQYAEDTALGQAFIGRDTKAFQHARGAVKTDFFGVRRSALVRNILDRITASPTEAEDIALLDRLLAMLQNFSNDPRAAGPSSKVLQNLTTKEYIREDQIVGEDRSCGLGEAICIRTQWPADPTGREHLGYEDEWAGNRFDIGTLKDVEYGPGLTRVQRWLRRWKSFAIIGRI